MTVKDSYLSVFLFLVVTPALLLLAPGPASYVTVAAFIAFFIVFLVRKPRRRCMPCGEIVTLNAFSYVKTLNKGLDCPRCGSRIKNKHRV